jgi:hypothetical protein
VDGYRALIKNCENEAFVLVNCRLLQIHHLMSFDFQLSSDVLTGRLLKNPKARFTT